MVDNKVSLTIAIIGLALLVLAIIADIFAFTSTGKIGFPGLTGPQGPQGALGVTGNTGGQGPTGIMGSQGQRGPVGKDGDAYTYSEVATFNTNVSSIVPFRSGQLLLLQGTPISTQIQLVVSGDTTVGGSMTIYNNTTASDQIAIISDMSPTANSKILDSPTATDLPAFTFTLDNNTIDSETLYILYQ